MKKTLRQILCGMAACALLAAVLALECRRLLRQAARSDLGFQEV